MKPANSRSSDEIRFIDVRGHRIRVSYRPSADSRPPLLLCNGLGIRLEGLQPFVDALDPKRGVIRFDAPGVGESDVTTFPYRMWQIAHLIRTILDSLGIDSVDVLGVSWGGALAQQYAFADRQRCKRVVLVSTALGTPTIPGRPAIIREMLSRRRFDDKEHAGRIAATLYGGKARDGGDISAAPFDAMRNSRRGLFYQQLATLGWSSVPFARWVRQPTLILCGDDDPIIPPVNGRLMKAVYPNAELQLFHDGHLGLLTSADDVAARVQQFLDRP